MMKIASVVVLLSLCSCSAIIDELCTPEDYCFECPACPECPTCPEVPECPVPPPCPDCPELPPVGPTPEPPSVTVERFTAGSLWKPQSDTDGNIVALIRSAYTEPFDACYGYRGGQKVKLDCRKWEDGRWVPNCFTNGNRQTFRFPFKCDKADEVKVTCELGNKSYVFTEPGAATCLRHE